MRDMLETAKKVYHNGVIPHAYTLSAVDVIELYEMAKQGPNGLWNAITTAFRFGFVMGNRCTITKKMKKI